MCVCECVRCSHSSFIVSEWAVSAGKASGKSPLKVKKKKKKFFFAHFPVRLFFTKRSWDNNRKTTKTHSWGHNGATLKCGKGKKNIKGANSNERWMVQSFAINKLCEAVFLRAFLSVSLFFPDLKKGLFHFG